MLLDLEKVLWNKESDTGSPFRCVTPTLAPVSWLDKFEQWPIDALESWGLEKINSNDLYLDLPLEFLWIFLFLP